MTPLAPVRRLVHLATAPLLALLLALAGSSAVLGHADLVSADPADGARLAVSPATITLVFAEALDAAKSSFKILTADGAVVATGRVAQDNPAALVADGLSLGPGGYTIRWTAGAGDGHLERGTTHFTVLAATPAPATPEPATPAPSAAPASSPTTPSDPTAAPASAAPPATATPTTPAEDPADTPPTAGTGDVLLPILAAIVVLGVIGVLVLRRSRAA